MSFTREEAKEFCNRAIDEIYDHNPKAFRLEIEAAVDTIPNYSVSYDGLIKLATYEDGCMKIATYEPENEQKEQSHE